MQPNHENTNKRARPMQQKAQPRSQIAPKTNIQENDDHHQHDHHCHANTTMEEKKKISLVKVKKNTNKTS